MATTVVDRRPVGIIANLLGEDARVWVWDRATGEQICPELVFPAEVHAVAVASDGRLVVGFDREVAVLTRC
ncbi:hypothetical protein OH805_37560 [Streptomyces sp. NBC_00879]|uniref:hypothetical protein n=1 Tax=Streptomyces sp. NBC_00879 TaxID=2975855 RepID=UPI0038631FA0|nr:hypothetical protein OH805_37560 [Streptomyces sp. NBC_00879]